MAKRQKINIYGQTGRRRLYHTDRVQDKKPGDPGYHAVVIDEGIIIAENDSVKILER